MSDYTSPSLFEICPQCDKKTASIHMRVHGKQETRLCFWCFDKITKTVAKGGHGGGLISDRLTRKLIGRVLLTLTVIAAVAGAVFYYFYMKKDAAPPAPAPVIAATPSPTPLPVMPPPVALLPAPVPIAQPSAPIARVARRAVKTMTLNLVGDVLFDFGQWVLKPGAEAALHEATDILGKHPDATLVVRGYTDSKGTPEANKTLSLKRAESVRDLLQKITGIAPQSLSVEGLGQADPIAPNTNPNGSDNPAGRERNRRVTLTVTYRAVGDQ